MGPGVLRLCSISIVPGGGIFENVCKSTPQEGQVRSCCRRHIPIELPVAFPSNV
jgi:aspartokinase-like uncharacterized kinase